MQALIVPNRSGSFPRVAELIGCSLTGAVPLGEVWAALPSLVDTPCPTVFPRSLFIEAVEEEYPFSAMHHGVVQGTVVLPTDVDSEEAHQELLHLYPSVLGWPVTVTGEVRRTGRGYGRVVRWGTDAVTALDRRRRFEELVTLDASTGDGWLVPGIGASKDLLDPLLLWWLLLYGFSILARYEPGHWRQLLDVDTSPWAVAIEAALDVATDTLPDLILHALDRAP
jgi:hypothetical protein